MGKRGKWRLAVGVVLVVLILSGFLKKEVKEQVKKSTGEIFCSFFFSAAFCQKEASGKGGI